MKPFKQFVEERNKKEAFIFQGRFQPITKAHATIILDAIRNNKNLEPFVIVVKGTKSGQDKKRNPFDIDTQIDLIRKSTNNQVKYIEVTKSAFIEDLVNVVRDKGYEPVKMFAGSDRVVSYRDMIQRYKDDLGINIEVEEIKRTDEDISATKVRNALLEDDFSTFERMTLNLDEKDFEKLQKTLKEHN